MSIFQQKLIAPNQLHHWELDIDAMYHASRLEISKDRFVEEIQALAKAFPTLIACAAEAIDLKESYGIEAYRPFLDQNELVVFDRGYRNAKTADEVKLPKDEHYAGFILRIPSPISGRPFHHNLLKRLEELEKIRPKRATLWKQAIIEVNGTTYLAPRFGFYFSAAHPHSDPPVMVWPEYFEMLNIMADHVYFAGAFYRLCLYANWREQPLLNVLQQRVIPRLLIDLLVADLQAENKLEQALELLDFSLYELYNAVGHKTHTSRIIDIYNQLQQK